jgi:hypothetical protein
LRITKEIGLGLYGKEIAVLLNDGSVFKGIWDDHISELDNEPEGESILLEFEDGNFVEIYTADIKNIEAASEQMSKVAISSMKELQEKNQRNNKKGISDES